MLKISQDIQYFLDSVIPLTCENKMRTYSRICIKDHTLKAKNGDLQSIKRGREYITSDIDENRKVMVFSTFWVNFDVSLFAGEEILTK